MLEAIEKLLILQDRDRKIQQLQAELGAIEPQRQNLMAKAQNARAGQEAARTKTMHLESERKKLELEVVGKQEAIARYSLQQFQTKKNEEYRALTHEIDHCKSDIAKLEDRQLELMEQMDAAHKELLEATRVVDAFKQDIDKQLSDLGERERDFTQRLAESLKGRDQLAAAVDPPFLARYDRLRRSKGDRDRVLVGVEHSVCGGCHMKLPTQIIVHCQGSVELVSCPNCGRILYFSPDMDLAVVD